MGVASVTSRQKVIQLPLGGGCKNRNKNMGTSHNTRFWSKINKIGPLIRDVTAVAREEDRARFWTLTAATWVILLLISSWVTQMRKGLQTLGAYCTQSLNSSTKTALFCTKLSACLDSSSSNNLLNSYYILCWIKESKMGKRHSSWLWGVQNLKAVTLKEINTDTLKLHVLFIWNPFCLLIAHDMPDTAPGPGGPV